MYQDEVNKIDIMYKKEFIFLQYFYTTQSRFIFEQY